MKNNKKKNIKIVRNLIFICLVYFVCSAFFGVISQIGDYKADIAAVSAKLEAEKQTYKELQEDKLNMHSEENYKDIARKTLGLVEPGDKVYINSNDNK